MIGSSLKIFTIHTLGNYSSSNHPAKIIKEGFCWWTFFFGPLKVLWERVWLAAVGLSLIYITLLFIAAGFNISGSTLIFLLFGIATIGGFNANDWKRRQLEKSGWRMIGVSSGKDADSAYRRFIDLNPTG